MALSDSGSQYISVAWLVRLIFNLTVARDYTPTADAANFVVIAQNLLHSGCFCLHPPAPTIDRAPVWPATIAAIYGFWRE